MSPELVWIVIAIIVVAAILGGIWWSRQRRTEQLRTRFGPEYDRTVQRTGTRAKAEAALQERARRVERLHISQLAADDAARFSDAWRRVQTQFVDDPSAAVTGADRLLGEVMQARGYPVGDFEQRVEDISVDHPNVVVNYRAARDIARRHDREQASTEDLRQAMVHYRSLFTELLEVTPAPRQEAHEPAGAHRGRA